MIMTQQEIEIYDAAWAEMQKQNSEPKVEAKFHEPQTVSAMRERRTRNVSAREAYRSGVGYKAILESQKVEEKKNRYGRILATAHLCMTEAINLFDEADSMCDNLLRNKFGYSHKAKMVNKTFDEYSKCITKQLTEDNLKAMVLDFKDFDTSVRYWANLNGWKQDDDISDLDATHAMILGIHRNFIKIVQEYIGMRAGSDKAEIENVKNELMKELKSIDDYEGNTF